MIAETVTGFINELPVKRLPSIVDAMLLLERLAMKGVRFAPSLIMLSKVMFTLDGILRDVGGSDTGMTFAIVRHLAQQWIGDRKAFRSPLMAKDWITLQCSALLYTTRLWTHCEQSLLDGLLPVESSASVAPA
jgi:hypothetical protein